MNTIPLYQALKLIPGLSDEKAQEAAISVIENPTTQARLEKIEARLEKIETEIASLKTMVQITVLLQITLLGVFLALYFQ